MKKQNKIWIYTSVWLAIILLSLAASFFNSVLLDLPFNIKQELPFLARWVIWLFITPVVLQIAGKIKYAENDLGKFIAYHGSIYVLVSAAHIILASILASMVNIFINGAAQYREILIKCALTGIFYNFVVYAIVLLLQNGLAYYQALQRGKTKILRLEKLLTDTRLQFLQQQLQPHFLFNAHHSIITLMKLGEKEKAITMMEKLSELMRITLRESNGQTVSLSRELEILQLYLDIQKIRFDDKLDVQYHIEDTTKSLTMPGMLLQPLVENSIKYAVENSPYPTTITIGASRENGSLWLSVKDASLHTHIPVDINKGIGLSNTEERLQQLYGNNYQLSFMPYQNKDQAGVEVKIKIPANDSL